MDNKIYFKGQDIETLSYNELLDIIRFLVKELNQVYKDKEHERNFILTNFMH